MTKKRASEIQKEVENVGGWHPKSITKSEDKEIREFWDTLDGQSCYYEAVCRMARGEHI